jgi:hypothetical protein
VEFTDEEMMVRGLVVNLTWRVGCKITLNGGEVCRDDFVGKVVGVRRGVGAVGKGKMMTVRRGVTAVWDLTVDSWCTVCGTEWAQDG